MEKLCMQVVLRRRGRTEVATGQAPECRKRKPGKVRISLASHSVKKEGLLAGVTEFAVDFARDEIPTNDG